jgi:hypothetical protein
LCRASKGKGVVLEMEDIVFSELKNAPEYLRTIYVWKDVLIGVMGPLLAALIAIWQVRQLVLSTRKQYFETIKQEQTGILKALSSELSAFIYFQFDLLEDLDQGRKEAVRHTPDRVIFSSNASRVGSMTGRTFGMLTIYYTRLDILVREIKESIEEAESVRSRLKLSIGHAALIRAGINRFAAGDPAAKLTEIDDETFEAAIAGYTTWEKGMLRLYRDEWLKYMQKRHLIDLDQIL